MGSAVVPIKAGLLLALALFHVHNFLVYDPAWGYDGRAHITVVWLNARSIDFNPVTIYAGTNPPLYYVLAGKILAATDSLKAVQAGSLLLFAASLSAIWIALRAVCRESPLRWPILVFFALNPLHLAYAYMILNYSLAQAIAVAFLCTLLALAVREDLRRPLLIACGLGLGAAAGIWTSLTNLALLPVGAAFALLHPALGRRARLLAAVVFLGTSLAAIAPYVALKNLEEGCFFCTRNRPVTTRAFYQVYPAQYYYWVSLKPFHQPHVPHFWKDGMWPVLYQTFFSDYFNYLVGPRYALTGRDPALTRVVPHSTDARRDREFTGLNYLALPLAAAMLAAFLIAARNAWRYLRARPPELFVDVVVCAASIAFFAQFVAYIHRYPDYVNIHAGYLFPIAAPLWVEVGRRLAPGPAASGPVKILWACLALYSALAAVTFVLQ